MRPYNFSAGPAMLPQAVLEQARSELLDWQGTGMSVMEISHRDPRYRAMTEAAEQNLRELMQIPDNYAVLFMHGGGRGQFSAVPQNLAGPADTVAYLNSGIWSEYAIREARKYVGSVASIGEQLRDEQGIRVTPATEWQLPEQLTYFHYCPNETVDGVAIRQPPQVEAPLVADYSSAILAEEIEVSRFGVIYAGAQKNIGPSGLAVVIVRKDLLEQRQQNVCTVMDYQVQAREKSLYNTPNTFAWYLAAAMFEWVKEAGGVAAMAEQNRRKAALLYECIDNSSFYFNQVQQDYRSVINIPFQLARPELDDLFLEQAAQQGLLALKGHRFVGGMRASMYNAMPYAGTRALVDFMTRFAREHG